MDRAVLAAFLCSAAAPAATCDPSDQMVAPSSITREAMQMTDAFNTLPTTLTAPELKP